MANSGPSKARAYRPTADEVAAGEVQEATEVVLEITDVKSEEVVFIETTFAGAHAARDALAGLLHEHASRSIVQQLEDELDDVMEVLMENGDSTNAEYVAAQGWARGLGTAISLMRGCDMDAVREAAMARYEEKQEAAE